MIAPVGCLQQPLVVVPLRPVPALLAGVGLRFSILVRTGNNAERDYVRC